MKTYKFLQLACVVALMGAATGCADDALVQTEDMTVSTKGQPITLQASVSGDASRVQYHEGEQKMTLTWESDDVLKVVNPNSEALITDFRLVEGTGKSFASFEGTPEVAFSDGDALYALYHNGLVESQFNTDGNLVLSLKEQDGTLNKDYQLMFGKTTYKEGTGLQAVSLHSLVSIFKVTIPTDRTLKKVTLDSGHFRNKATLVLQKSPSDLDYHTFSTGDLVYNCADDEVESNSDVSVSGTFVPKNGEVTVYFYVFPTKRYGGYLAEWDSVEDHVRPTFTVEDEQGNVYESINTFSDRSLTGGKMYRLHSGIFQEENFANEDTSNGWENDPYEIANVNQLYTFMNRLAKNRQNKYGNSYNGMHYKLTADIHLNNERVWVPISLWWGSFDGNGKTISGNITMKDVWQTGFFQEINGSVIRNLTLDFDRITFEKNEHHDYFGTLVGSANQGSQIINCVNHSNVTGDFRIMGGLVGYLFNSSMIACANTGNLATTDYTTDMGGLVGVDDKDSQIMGCYNTGNLNSQSFYDNSLHIGGLVGTLRGQLSSSWSYSSISMAQKENYMRGGLIGYCESGSFMSCFWQKSEDYEGVGGNQTNETIGSFEGNRPNDDQIDEMNKGLKEKRCDYLFDNNGGLYSNAYSGGTSSGSNFGNGGEF